MSARHPELVARVQMLTQDQREAAYQAARTRIAGPQPTLDASAAGWSKYPRRVLVTINAVGGVMLLAAFVPSAIRLYLAGASATAAYLSDDVVQVVIGVMSVLLAEAGQIGLTLWASTVPGRWLRAALYAGALLCTLFAYVGNYSVVMSEAGQPSVLLLFEIFLPPTLVLIAANVLKAQVLDQVEARHAIAVRHAQALAVWRTAFDGADSDSAWDRTLANCLRDALREANRSSRALLRELDREDWIALIVRERTAEEWWDVQPDAPRLSAPAAGVTPDGHMTAEQVAAHLKVNREDAALSVRQLASKLKTTKHAADRGRTMYRMGEES